MPNKLSEFWQELKRRNVVRVITVYAGAAFVILELVDIITEPFGLPDWSLRVAFFILLAGLVIAVIVSWIYDVHPEGGIVKSKPTEKVPEELVLQSFKGWKIASYISFVVIVALIVLNIIPRSNSKTIVDKSIAVLPFRNDSPDESKMYFINGTMEAILDNLCKIEDLRVPGRTSVEQYRNISKPIPDIAEELNVSYILVGSGQKLGNRLLLTVRLLDGKSDQHIWSKQYNREITQVEDLLSIPSEIAQLVATEIEAVITPEEKIHIENKTNTNLTAHDFYLRGKEEQLKFWIDDNNREALERAENLYNQALNYDSTFAMAYTGLAFVYWAKQYWDTFFSENFLDSVLILSDLALTYNDQLSNAYTIKGNYYRQTGRYDEAIEEFDEAIQLNPNDWEAYVGRGWVYYDDDVVKTIENFHKAADLNRGQHLPKLLRRLGLVYSDAGFWDKAKHYHNEALKLDRDSSQYFKFLAYMDRFTNNSANHNEYYLKAYALDTNNTMILPFVGESFMSLQQYEESIKYYQKYVDRLRQTGDLDIDDAHRIGYAFLKNGYLEEADYFFNMQLEYCNKSIELNRIYAQNKYAYYDLAAIYAIRGEKEKAIYNLRIFNQREIMPVWASEVQGDPLFDKIRDEPEYLQILEEAKSKYFAEHERVRQWLEENDML